MDPMKLEIDDFEISGRKIYLVSDPHKLFITVKLIRLQFCLLFNSSTILSIILLLLYPCILVKI